MEKVQLSPHFIIEEMCKTNVKLNNVPNEAQVANLKRLCGWLEMLRSEWNSRYGGGNDPIIINSAFRSPQVNKAVGGVATSNHLSGCAADIKVKDIRQLIRYAVILLDISEESGEAFDELLIERSSSGAIWLHFAVRPTGNRRKIKFMQT
ncbi:D-Ala-D-Ala carboxypeptidase family metallohydrolase [Prevotella sp. P6B4]|uniref:D-Ala-D-Ala carboxypeptidase family metallohydrolase n=1 Tax=Prevotella sp. P6B4 TaxID=1410614 RepID=UPI0006850C20|nr:D-Ala-D-Ala carboxypeptidase family metallohydrolase [Prevotella sp. P6B4]